jgi:hypothetical protein
VRTEIEASHLELPLHALDLIFEPASLDLQAQITHPDVEELLV